jgi:hypothetical protein
LPHGNNLANEQKETKALKKKKPGICWRCGASAEACIASTGSRVQTSVPPRKRKLKKSKLGMVAHTYNLSTQEGEKGRSQV